ncbi:bifunctional metallophosphatase/5'-nucleotidase [Bacillus sp. DJP31]|uniref:bifunctional metallophosphatase/5'-nucleotidase n=1 Tax=Bacillus sp. DJP31 TaxID=3409789 RepID=UPI003BB7894E
MKEHIHLYHINDLHSHFKNWPKVVNFINEKRQLHQKNGEEMLVFDIGDHVDRFHPISEATLGKANIRLMNQLGYDYVTIGNNEGITLSKGQLDDLYIEANFNVVVANLFEKNGARPNWAKPYAIHETGSGTKLGIIGLTVPYQKFYELLDWDVKDPFDLLPALVKEIKDLGVHFVVVLSHLGITEDERLAREIDEVSLILGAHTHHLLQDGLKVNETMLCGAGKFGMNVGHVKLLIEPEEKRVTDMIPTVFSMEDVKDCEETASSLRDEIIHAQLILDKKITTTSKELEVKWFHSSILPSMLAEAIREWCEAEIGMVNSGVLLESLPKGDITVGDLHRICPHPINPCKVVLRGAELKEVILQAASPRMEQLQMKGFGFRGEVLGKMEYDGVDVHTIILEDGLPHVTDIFIHGEPIESERNYIVATLDMFTFGRLYPEISHAKEKQYFLPEMLRDLLKWKLLRNAL